MVGLSFQRIVVLATAIFVFFTAASFDGRMNVVSFAAAEETGTTERYVPEMSSGGVVSRKRLSSTRPMSPLALFSSACAHSVLVYFSLD